MKLDVLTFNFQSIQLNQLNWRDFLQYQNPVAAALMAKMKIAEKDRPKVKVECLRLLVNLQLDPARNFLISGFVDTYLRLNPAEEEVFQTEIARIEPATEQEKIMQLTTSWMEQGIEQGLEQGIEQGLEQERRSAISGLLELRYGAIDDQLTAILPTLMILTSVEYTPLIFQLSKPELIEHLKNVQN
jgi:flagellar biosynthesis/type III secretory pathway protein FliH